MVFIVRDEINAVNAFIESMKLDDEDKKTAINIFNNAKSDSYSIYEYASQYKEIANQEMRKIIYAVLWDVAYSDGTIHESENDILKNIPKYLGLNSGIYDEYNAQVLGHASQTDLDKYYEVLGCNSDSSDSEVKKCYRQAMAKYHPDKIQSKGLPKEFIKFANEQSKKINKAYSAIKQKRKQ